MSEEEDREEGEQQEEGSGQEGDGATWWRLTFTIDGENFWSRFVKNKGEPALRDILEAHTDADFDRGMRPCMWRSSYPWRKSFRVDYLVDIEEINPDEVVAMLRGRGG